MKAVLRNIRISDKKMNLVAAMVRQKSVDETLAILSFLPKKAAKFLKEAVQSAAANATNNFKQKKENLYVKSIVVNEGATLKRFRPVSRGRAHPIRKKTCHVTVEVGVQVPEEKAVKKTPMPIKKTKKKSVQ